MMKNRFILLSLVLIGCTFFACKPTKIVEQTPPVQEQPPMNMDDSRISLHLNPMQKEHQLLNMRAHLEAVQTILSLLSKDNFDKASEVAYNELGSTTEMQLMCASFGNVTFENMGMSFHKSADRMSEIFKSKDKNKSLEALSNTMDYCVKCHLTFRQ